MKITVIGGGNIGTLMAAEMAFRGHSVTIYTSKPETWQNDIEVYDADDHFVLSGHIRYVTNNIKEAMYEAEIIWITVPAQAFEKTANDMLPYAQKGQIIGVVPGSGGAEFAFYPLLQKGCILFGFQRVHSIARLKEYGKSVYMLGRKTNVQLGAIPKSKTEIISETVSRLLDMPCVSLPNYLCVTLTPSNPILHTTRLYSMLKEYKTDFFYPRNFLFYEEWTNESSEMLLKCDEELQQLCKSIPLELDDVKSLKVHYEIETAQSLTKKIQSIRAFKGLSSPMISVSDNKWIPDFESRYFTADFSYGLKIILDLCNLFEVNAPNITKVWDWYISTAPNASHGRFNMSLAKDEFIDLYD